MDVDVVNRSSASIDFLPHYSHNDTSGVQVEIMPVKIIKFLLYALVFVIGFGGNCVVIWITVGKQKARNFHNMLLRNLAVADIAFLSINLPFRLAYQENNYVWPFGRSFCKIIPMFTYLFLTASSLTLVAISYERYRNISSLSAQSGPSTPCAKLMIALLWAVSYVPILPFHIFLDVVKNKEGRPVCTDIWPSPLLEKLYFLFLFVLQFLLPTIVMVVVYIRVGTILKKAHLKMATFGLTNAANRNLKAVRMICAIVAVYILLTLPYHITWQLRTFGIKNALAKKFSVLLVTATSASHPIIYGALHKEFAPGFKAFLRRSKRARRHFLSLSIKNGTLRFQSTPEISNMVTSSNDDLPFEQYVQKITAV